MRYSVYGVVKAYLGARQFGAFSLLILGLSLMGCPPNSGGGGDGGGVRPAIDLVVGDNGASSIIVDANLLKAKSNIFGQYIFYFDVLAEGDDQDPDLVITGEEIGGNLYPISTVLTESDLYGANLNGDVIIIRDYRSFGDAKGGGSPVIHLTGEGNIQYPSEVVVENDRLYVAYLGVSKQNQPAFTIDIFEHAAAIDSDRAPDASLFFGAKITDIEVVGNRLWVADSANDAVYFWSDVRDLIDNGVIPPDAILAGDSWLGLGTFGGGVNPEELLVANNHLYVSTETNHLFVFSPANGLVDEQAPDAAIVETNGALSNPSHLVRTGSTLFAGNAGLADDIFEGLPKSDKVVNELHAGLVAFSDAGDLAIGQQPFAVFHTANTQISFVGDMAQTSNTLFVATTSQPDPVNDLQHNPEKGITETPIGDVHIFQKASNLLVPRQGDIVLPALKDFRHPLSIAVNDRFTGEPQD